jgi:hypothetical protein
MKKLAKRIIIAIISILFIAPFFYFTLNYIGFCFKECKFLSDKEKIDNAVKVALAEMYTKYENGTYYPDPKYNIEYLKPKENGNMYLISDEDVINFKADNTDCCSLSKSYYKKKTDDYFRISFSSKKSGLASDLVTVKFKYKDIDGEEKVGTRLIPISNCGEKKLSVIEATN